MPYTIAVHCLCVPFQKYFLLVQTFVCIFIRRGKGFCSFFHRHWIQHIAANVKTYRIGLTQLGTDVAVSGEVIFQVALAKDGIDLPSVLSQRRFCPPPI